MNLGRPEQFFLLEVRPIAALIVPAFYFELRHLQCHLTRKLRVGYFFLFHQFDGEHLRFFDQGRPHGQCPAWNPMPILRSLRQLSMQPQDNQDFL